MASDLYFLISRIRFFFLILFCLCSSAWGKVTAFLKLLVFVLVLPLLELVLGVVLVLVGPDDWQVAVA